MYVHLVLHFIASMFVQYVPPFLLYHIALNKRTLAGGALLGEFAGFIPADVLYKRSFTPNANISKSIFTCFTTYIVSVAEKCWKTCLKVFSCKKKNCKGILLCVQRVFCAALVSFKSTNSFVRTACLTMHDLICLCGILRLCWSIDWCHKSELVSQCQHERTSGFSLEWCTALGGLINTLIKSMQHTSLL